MRINIHIRVEIPFENPHMLYSATCPEDKSVPDFIKIRHHKGKDKIFYEITAVDVNNKKIWTIRNTLNDYLFAVKLVIKIWDILERF